MIEDEFDYYLAEQDAIVAGHIGEWTLIEDRKVHGYYKNIEAVIEASAGHRLGEFMIKQCKPKGEDMVYVYNQERRFS
jgi:hypothetical protein